MVTSYSPIVLKQNDILSNHLLLKSSQNFKFFSNDVLNQENRNFIKSSSQQQQQPIQFVNQINLDAKSLQQNKKIIALDKKWKRYLNLKQYSLETVESNRISSNKSKITSKDDTNELKRQKMRALQRELQIKYNMQKQAINQYLEGKPVNEEIIKNYKDVTNPTLIKSHDKDPQLFNPEKSNKRKTESALIQMQYPEHKKISKKIENKIDPIKLQMKEYLDKFLKEEKIYFKMLTEAQKKGENHFKNSIEVSQKFYYNQLETPDSSFNQNNDLKVKKICPIIKLKKIQSQNQVSQHMIQTIKSIQAFGSFKKIEFNQNPQNSNTSKVNKQNSIEQLQQQPILSQNGKLSTVDIIEQAEKLEKFHQTLLKTKQKFGQNINTPSVYLDFLKLVKTNQIQEVLAAIQQDKTLVNKATDHLKQGPLHWASKRGFKELSIQLINKGADLFAEDVNGKTPLDLAIFQKQDRTIHLLQKELMILKVEQQMILNNFSQKKNKKHV